MSDPVDRIADCEIDRPAGVGPEDGRRAGGIYVWASCADADRLHEGEWRPFVEKKFGVAPTIDYLESPVMIDNRERQSA